MANRELSAIQDNLATARYLLENAHEALEKLGSDARPKVLHAHELVDDAMNSIGRELKWSEGKMKAVMGEDDG